MDAFQRYPRPTVVPQPLYQRHAVLLSEYFFHSVGVVFLVHGGKFLLVKFSDDRFSLVILQLVQGGISPEYPLHLENFLREVGLIPFAEGALVPAHPDRISDPELWQWKLSESRAVKGYPRQIPVGRVYVLRFHEGAAVLGGVVIFNEFVQRVDPVVGSLAVKKFPHHGFQGSVEPFHDGGLFVGMREEIIYVVTLQKALTPTL